MLTEELMKKVRELEIAMRRSVSEVFSGEYSSAFRGRGMEFSEVREYQPGDDVRNIDWNVTARQGAPFIKRYVEERELTVMLAVDLSPSGRFGSGSRAKNEAAAELCGVVAMAAVKNNDKVGLVVFTDRVERYVPPAKGRTHVLRILRDLLEFQPDRGRGTDIGGALEHLGRGRTPEAVRAGVGVGVETRLSLMNRRHDVIAARLFDPRERAMPSPGAGLIEIEDAETGARLVIDASSPRVRREFAEHAARRTREMSDRMRRLGIDGIEVSPDQPYVHALVELFRRRERRR
jgi:uncharacterized protein (DUF58 family)